MPFVKFFVLDRNAVMIYNNTSIIANSYADTYESVFVSTGAGGNFKISGFHTYFNTTF